MKLEATLDKFFTVYKKPIKMDDIIKKFKIKNELISELEDALYSLEKKGKIYCDENKEYTYVPDEFYLYHGKLKISNANQGYLELENGSTIIIPKNKLKGAHKNDIVFISKSNKKNKHPKCFYGEIVRIVRKEYYKGNNTYITNGILKKEGNIYYIKNDDKKIYISFENINSSYVGDLVNVQLTSQSDGKVLDIIKRNSEEHVFECIDDNKWIPYGSSYKEFYLNSTSFDPGDLIVAKINNDKLEFIRKIENKGIINRHVEALIIDYGFSTEFSRKVLKEAIQIPLNINDKSKNRRDLRNLETITIDPASAKDLDDSISLKYDNDKYYLYVHIADPANYINLNSEIFKEALKRSFSIYPSEYVIPMLPEILANKVCSLNENGDKLALTCKMVLDKNGTMLDFEIFKSIIRNNKQMSYDKVNDILEDRNIHKDYIPYIQTLIKMDELSKILTNERMERGAIFIENQEDKISVDDLGNPIDLSNNYRGPAQNIIENFMILANETVSNWAYYMELPYIFRNHENPSISKSNKLYGDLKQMGYSINRFKNVEKPKMFQTFLKKFFEDKNEDEVKFLSKIILCSFNRAYYDDKNIGHFGLALDCYGTFTSPIRKVSDLLNHMVITEYLENGINTNKMNDITYVINNSCKYISEKQKEIEFLEQEVDNLLLKQYAQDFIGKEFDATILFINKEGIYIKTSNKLCGMIYIDKRYKISFDNIIDTKEGKVYKVGHQVKVILNDIDKNNFVFKLSKVKNESKKLIKRRD